MVVSETVVPDVNGPSLFAAVIGGEKNQVRATRAQILSVYDKYSETSTPLGMSTRGPFKHPSELRLSEEQTGPLEASKRPSRPVGYQKFYDSSRKKGKIGSKRDARLETLGPLSPCMTKKPCQCHTLTMEYQSQVRKLYCDKVRDSNHDGGRDLLCSFMIPNELNSRSRFTKIQNRAILPDRSTIKCLWCRSDPNVPLPIINSNHKFKEKQCPYYLQSQQFVNENQSWTYTYQIPLLRDDNICSNPATVCLDTFTELFQILPQRMDALRKRKKKLICSPHSEDLLSQPRGVHKLSQDVREGLSLILETEPRMSSHYAPQDEDNSRKYYYCGGLSRFYFWKKYLNTNGNDGDKNFISQCIRMGFYPTYQREKSVRIKPNYSKDVEGKKLHPSVSYSTAMKHWKQYDIKFDSRRCDICERCFSLTNETQNKLSTTAEKHDAKTRLLEHQRLAQLAIWVRGQWKLSILLEHGRRELLQIDFAANPRCPYMDIGQAFYNRILGVSFFVITSKLLQRTFICMFDETMAKKGSDEVISMVNFFIEKFLPKTVVSLDVCCDGCAGQSWNNRLALFFEDLVDPNSSLGSMLECNVRRVDLFRCISGHTYMEPDTEGGRVQRAARTILMSYNEGFVHVMVKNLNDPTYTRAWKDVANSVPGIEVVEPALTDFHCWSSHLLPPQAGGTSELYIVPNKMDCFRGPHSYNKSWRISNSHYLNFGYGEDVSGKVVAHHGVWFSRDSFEQHAPDEVYVRQFVGLNKEDWKSKQAEMSGTSPKQKQTERSALPIAKQEDLYQLGRIMARDKHKEDFIVSYPKPVKQKTQKQEDEFVELEKVARAILRKDVATWKSNDYKQLLRWKMKDGAAKYTTKATTERHSGSVLQDLILLGLGRKSSGLWRLSNLATWNTLELPMQVEWMKMSMLMRMRTLK